MYRSCRGLEKLFLKQHMPDSSWSNPLMLGSVGFHTSLVVSSTLQTVDTGHTSSIGGLRKDWHVHAAGKTSSLAAPRDHHLWGLCGSPRAFAASEQFPL